MTPTPDTEPGTVVQEPLYRLNQLTQEDPARKFNSITHLLTPKLSPSTVARYCKVEFLESIEFPRVQ